MKIGDKIWALSTFSIYEATIIKLEKSYAIVESNAQNKVALFTNIYDSELKALQAQEDILYYALDSIRRRLRDLK